LRFKLVNRGHNLVDQVLLVRDIPLNFTLRNVVRPLVLVLLDLDPFDLLPRLFGLLLLFDGFNLNLVDDVLSFKPQMSELHVLGLLLLGQSAYLMPQIRYRNSLLLQISLQSCLQVQVSRSLDFV
jgi:hypothetical protein